MAARQSIQIQVRERELCSKPPADSGIRIRNSYFNTRGDEASKGKSLRHPTTCAGGEDGTKRESSIRGGPASRIQGLRLDERASGISGCLPCLEEQSRCLTWRQHKREKVCRTGVFSFRNGSSQALSSFAVANAITVSLPLDRVLTDTLVPLSPIVLSKRL